MQIASMFKDIIAGFFHKPVTRLYPVEPSNPPDEIRGVLHWEPEKCTGCALCVKDCPTQAIELVEIDRKAKRFVMRYHMDQCIYCGQCVQSCRFNCLSMSPTEWELASTDKEAFNITYGRDEDVAELPHKPD